MQPVTARATMLPDLQTYSQGGLFGITEAMWCLCKGLHIADGCPLESGNPIFLGLLDGDVEEARDVGDDGSGDIRYGDESLRNYSFDVVYGKS